MPTQLYNNNANKLILESVYCIYGATASHENMKYVYYVLFFINFIFISLLQSKTPLPRGKTLWIILYYMPPTRA